MVPVDDISGQNLVGGGFRGWVEIAAKMLQACEKGALKTHIMYQSNLNSAQIAHYMKFLEENELVERVKGSSSDRPIYRTARKGMEYLKAYSELENVLTMTARQLKRE